MFKYAPGLDPEKMSQNWELQLGNMFKHGGDQTSYAISINRNLVSSLAIGSKTSMARYTCVSGMFVIDHTLCNLIYVSKVLENSMFYK